MSEAEGSSVPRCTENCPHKIARSALATEIAGRARLRAFNGRYLQLKGIVGGKWMVHDAPHVTGLEWFIEERDGKVVLRNNHHRGWFLRALPDGTIVMIKKAEECDMWTPVKNNNGTWSFESADGRWLSADGWHGHMCTKQHKLRREQFKIESW